MLWLCYFILRIPTEKSRASLPMRWNQPPKKTVAPDRANNMNFVKPSDGDDLEVEVHLILVVVIIRY